MVIASVFGSVCTALVFGMAAAAQQQISKLVNLLLWIDLGKSSVTYGQFKDEQTFARARDAAYFACYHTTSRSDAVFFIDYGCAFIYKENKQPGPSLLFFHCWIFFGLRRVILVKVTYPNFRRQLARFPGNLHSIFMVPSKRANHSDFGDLLICPLVFTLKPAS